MFVTYTKSVNLKYSKKLFGNRVNFDLLAFLDILWLYLFIFIIYNLKTSMTESTENTPEELEGGDKPFNRSYGKLMMWFFLITDVNIFQVFNMGGVGLST